MLDQARLWQAHCPPFVDWLSSLGDPSALGWITTIAYLGTAFLSYLTLKAARTSDGPEYRVFWRLAALGFVFLGINKQLDLQILFTALMRCAALAGGWFAERRHDQHLFVVGLVLTGSALVAIAWFCFRRIICLVAPAMLGITLVSTFVIIRAASFQHEEEASNISLPSPSSAHIGLELLGISFVALNAVQLLNRGKL